MDPASGRSPGLSFDAESLGRPQTWTVHHRGLEYRGEVIVTEAVSPEWSLPLEDGLGFRLVFYTVPRRLSGQSIQDPRIDMVVPRRSLAQMSQTLGREIQYIHETRQRYSTARDVDALTMRQSMEEREASVRGEMARQYAQAYSQGRIYSHPRVRSAPETYSPRTHPSLGLKDWPRRSSSRSIRASHLNMETFLTLSRRNASLAFIGAYSRGIQTPPASSAPSARPSVLRAGRLPNCSTLADVMCSTLCRAS